MAVRFLKLLPFVLSVIAGSVDTITFLGLDRLFTAHITGNFVVLAARFAAGDAASVAQILALPMFALSVGAARLFATLLEERHIGSLVPLLSAQLLMLVLFFVIAIAAGPRADPNGTALIFGAMLGVAAMAIQNSAVRISLDGAPSTVVMTMNITAISMDAVDILFGGGSDARAKARSHARITWPAIAGFFLGCALGALGESRLGLRALAAPVCFALLALVLGIGAQHGARRVIPLPSR